MLITQKAGRYKAIFDFGDEKLDYVFTENFSKSGGSVSYEKIPTEWVYRKRYPAWRLKYLSGFIFTVAIFLGVMDSRYGIKAALCTWTFFTVIALLFYGLTCLGRRAKLTVIKADPNIFVIHTDNYQEIMDEVAKRRGAQIRKKYMDIDFLNSPARESQKFRFLRYEGIITEREYQDAYVKLIAAQQKPTSSIS